jgi:hypothetical protein
VTLYIAREWGSACVDQYLRLLAGAQLPAWLTAESKAWVLNCQPLDVPVLVATKLLNPLDNSRPNSVKCFGSQGCWNSQKTGLGWQRSQMP